MNLGIVVFAHGSSVEAANAAIRAVAADMQREGGFALVEAAFLDCTEPTLAQSVQRLIERGAARILVVPYFLTLGTHLQRDLPKLVEAIAREHAGLRIAVTEPLDGHPALVQILLERVRQAIKSGEQAG
jgi:sirohydrochlorin ferrochelatase